MAMQAAELSVQTSDTALLSCLMLYCSHTDEDWGDSWCSDGQFLHKICK